ncbi:MAG: hypothetical protein LUH07_05440 [Lachnospiraceae bacterium]|nr:hypothetical protein [Lachnospiraceae bacterium]
MKMFEWEEMIREEGREKGLEEGREAQRIYTEQERHRADMAENELKTMREEMNAAMSKIRQLTDTVLSLEERLKMMQG